MNATELKDYLKAVMETEKALYAQKRIVGNLEREKSKLGIPRKIDKPDLMRKGPGYYAFFGGFVGAIPVAIVLFVASAFVPSLGDFMANLQNVYKPFLGMLLSGFAVLLTYPVFGFFISVVLGFLLGLTQMNDEKAQVKKREQQYMQALVQEKERLEKERKMAEKLDQELQSIKFTNNETRAVLQRLYDLDVIYPKYRNLVAVCMFYEYLDARRCDTLEGHEGAINTYETELRLNRIIGQLDTVISQLDNISENQMILYKAITETNSTSKRILDNTYAMVQQNEETARQLGSIKTNTAIGAYNASVAARNSELLVKYKTREVVAANP